VKLHFFAILPLSFTEGDMHLSQGSVWQFSIDLPIRILSTV